MQRLGLLSNGSQAGLLIWKLVGNSCYGNLAALSCQIFHKKNDGSMSKCLKVKSGQSCSTHKFSMSWLNNSWTVGYIHATRQVLYWMLFLLQARLGKPSHHEDVCVMLSFKMLSECWGRWFSNEDLLYPDSIRTSFFLYPPPGKYLPLKCN